MREILTSLIVCEGASMIALASLNSSFKKDKRICN